MNKVQAKQILVSVIVPCYNVEEYIAECLMSIYGQSYSLIEIICVDNNSTDKTLDILNSYKIKFNNLTVIKEPVKGASNSRNAGLKIAKGEWIQFLDADDIILPNKIQHQIELILAHKVDFIVASSIIRLKNRDNFIKDPDADCFIGLMNSNLGNTCANLFNKKALQIVDNWNENLDSSQEYDLMFRLIKLNRKYLIDDVPQTIINSRDYGQISQMNPKKTWTQFVLLRIEILNFIKASHPNYFKNKYSIIHQILFDSIRILYKYDSELSINTYMKYLSDFTPFKTKSTGYLYILVFKFFGFSKTEFLRNKLKFQK